MTSAAKKEKKMKIVRDRVKPHHATVDGFLLRNTVYRSSINSFL
jgi:hypothetical protein